MNKQEIVTIVTAKLNGEILKQDVGRVVNTLVETIKESLMNNQKVSFKSFLTFEPVIRPAKKGTSFGRDWTKSEQHALRIKVSSSFKELLASKTEGIAL